MDTKTILIADDDPVILRMLAAHLEAAGYAVVQANNGEAAVRLARRSQPDLIILDIMMPGMDGGDAGQALKDAPRTCNIPIVFLSSLVTTRVDRRGEHTLLAKPYNHADLLEVVRERTT